MFGQAYALNSVELVVLIAQSDLRQIAPVKNRRVQILTDGQRLDAFIDRVSAELIFEAGSPGCIYRYHKTQRMRR